MLQQRQARITLGFPLFTRYLAIATDEESEDRVWVHFPGGVSLWCRVDSGIEGVGLRMLHFLLDTFPGGPQ